MKLENNLLNSHKNIKVAVRSNNIYYKDKVYHCNNMINCSLLQNLVQDEL